MIEHNSDAGEIEIEAIGVEVDSQPIELYKVLKIANAVSGGGEAKYAIGEGYVTVNGEIELRKRRKMYDGDLVEFNQEFYLVMCNVPAATEQNTLPPEQPSTLDKKAAKSSPQDKPKDKSKRGQINFLK